MRSIFGILLLSVFLFGILFGYTRTVEAGFGISPPRFRNDHLSPGSHYEQDIYLVQGSPETNIKITVAIENAEQIVDWITIQPAKEFIIPKGIQQFPMRVIVDVPKDAGYATYTGKMRIVATSQGVPQEEGGGNIAVRLGALADISLTVTSDEYSDFKIQSIDVPDIEEGWPIEVRVSMENFGNVKVRPTRIMLTIYDKWHENVLQTGEAKTTDWVDSFAVGSVRAYMPTELGPGDYFADFEIYKGEELAAKDKQRFFIVEQGTIDYWPRYFGISIAWWATGVGVILAFGVVIKFNLFGRLLRGVGIEVRRTRRR